MAKNMCTSQRHNNRRQCGAETFFIFEMTRRHKSQTRRRPYNYYYCYDVLINAKNLAQTCPRVINGRWRLNATGLLPDNYYAYWE